MSKFSTWLNSLTADASPDTAADYLVSYDASATTSKKVLMSVLLALATGSGMPNDGWVASSDTWTYASADSPTFTFTISGVDRTNVLQPGMRIKLTQTTAKYFIITAVAFSTNTTVTIYGGTDYTLANAAITSPYYSALKAPYGFNTSPSKWTVEVLDTTLRTQATPTANTWYNNGSLSISIPIGVWHVSYHVSVQRSGSAGTWDVITTLSTANNSQSDAEFSAFAAYAGSIAENGGAAYRWKVLTLAAKTSYYLNMMTRTASLSNMYFRNDLATCAIRAVSAYL